MAIETLRPNGAGDECSIDEEVGAACPNHYQNVDEALADDATTLVKTDSDVWLRDLYNLPAPSGSGTINSITVYVRHKRDSAQSERYCIRHVVKSGTTIDEELYGVSSGLTWGTTSRQLTTNPNTSSAWTWANIADLQIGVGLLNPDDSNPAYSYCTQVYVEVDYTAAAATSIKTLNGTPIANFAKWNGTAIASYKTIFGISNTS